MAVADDLETERPAPPRRRAASLPRALLVQGRPRQWTKNILVFAAPGAAHVLTHGRALAESCLLFVAFCLVSSGTYYWNDLFDLEADRLHATKRFRPIASGTIPVSVARLVGTGLVVLGLILATTVGWRCTAVLTGYVVVTLSYSAGLKHIAVIDLVAVASGFVLRAIAGAVAVSVPLSTWFLLFTSFGSLFVVTGKRYAELREYGQAAAQARATLEAYSITYLHTVLSVAVTASLLTYCIWAFEVAQLHPSNAHLYEISIVPMICALLRYTLVLEQGHGAAPEEVFLADRALQCLGLVWLVITGAAIYLS